MPRKKAAAATGLSDSIVPPSPAPAIACPACKSKISSDGKTLHEKSAYLEDLLETEAGVDEVEKNITALEKKIAERDAKIADLSGQLAASLAGKGRVDLAPAKTEKKTEKENKPNVGSEEQKPKSWWD